MMATPTSDANKVPPFGGYMRSCGSSGAVPTDSTLGPSSGQAAAPSNYPEARDFVSPVAQTACDDPVPEYCSG
jgi:hypothetical protein